MYCNYPGPELPQAAPTQLSAPTLCRCSLAASTSSCSSGTSCGDNATVAYSARRPPEFAKGTTGSQASEPSAKDTGPASTHRADFGREVGGACEGGWRYLTNCIQSYSIQQFNIVETITVVDLTFGGWTHHGCPGTSHKPAVRHKQTCCAVPGLRRPGSRPSDRCRASSALAGVWSPPSAPLRREVISAPCCSWSHVFRRWSQISISQKDVSAMHPLLGSKDLEVVFDWKRYLSRRLTALGSTGKTDMSSSRREECC